MAADINDLLGRPSNPSNYAIATTVKTNRSIGVTSLEAHDLSKWATDTPVYFITYKKTVDPATDKVTITNKTGWKALVNADTNTLTNLTLAPGYTDIGNVEGDFIECIPTALWGNDLIDWALAQHKPDGSHGDVTADSVETNEVTIGSQEVGLLGNVRVYELSGSPHTWTKPANLKFIEVEAVGGGGGGGGRMSTNATQLSAGGGGGGGGYCYKKINAASLSSTETVTIGARGTGSNGAAGSAGGDTTFGAHLTAGGGGGGGTGRVSNDSTTGVGAGGSAGVAVGGDLNIDGQEGTSGSVGKGMSYRGDGGGSMFASSTGFYGASGLQTTANGRGGGGSGVMAFENSSSSGGGSGTPGVVIVREYF